MSMAKRKLNVDEGRVNCPRRGDIDVEICYSCPDLRDIRLEGALEALTCRARAEAVTLLYMSTLF